MPPTLNEEEIDDLLYFSRVGDSNEFNTLLSELCKRENCSVPELLSVARDPESGNGVLHMLSANGFSELLSTLTKTWPQTPDILQLLNTQNTSLNTPLHWAALNGHLECVKILLEQGADPMILNGRGHDAIYEAELAERRDVVEWVLREGGEGVEKGLGGGDGGEGEGEGEEGGEEGMVVDEKGLQGQLEEEVERLEINSREEKGIEA